MEAMRNENFIQNLDRILRFFLAILLFRYSFELYWTGLLTYPLNLALMMSMHFTAVLLLIDSVLKIKYRLLYFIGTGLLLSGILVLFTIYFTEPHLGTDGILYTRYSIDLLLKGENPYLHSMLPAYEKYG